MINPSSSVSPWAAVRSLRPSDAAPPAARPRSACALAPPCSPARRAAQESACAGEPSLSGYAVGQRFVAETTALRLVHDPLKASGVRQLAGRVAEAEFVQVP